MAKRRTEELKVIESCGCGCGCSAQGHKAPTRKGEKAASKR
ncbi:MAG TPA: hypothetical protein VFC31_00885 [Candidatus Limnocylindria bacterium]|nr:hypothetical protein [Candidatus Limnocylindria bacterium]